MKLQLMIEVELTDPKNEASVIEAQEKKWLQVFGLERYVVSLVKRTNEGQLPISFDVRIA